jgi:uncharacterized membrane protein YdjX (TVP38/TMEM64 family)
MRVSATARRMSWSTRAVIVAGVLALLLVAAVPVALLVGIILMLLGHVVGGLALFGGSILAAGAAVVIAGFSGVRHLRRVITQRSFRDFNVVQLRRGDYDYDAR